MIEVSRTASDVLAAYASANESSPRTSGRDPGQEPEREREHRRDDLGEDRRQQVDAEGAPPRALHEPGRAAHRHHHAAALEHERGRREQQPVRQPHAGDDRRAAEREAHEEPGDAADRVRHADADEHRRADTADEHGTHEQADEQGDAEQRPDAGLGALPCLRGRHAAAEHGLTHDDREHARGDDLQHPRHERGDDGGAVEADHLVGRLLAAQGGVGEDPAERGRAPEEGGRELDEGHDERDHGGDAEDRARVAADVGDRAVEDLAEPERAQRDDAGLRGQRHRAPADDAGQRRPAPGRRSRRAGRRGVPTRGRSGGGGRGTRRRRAGSAPGAGADGADQAGAAVGTGGAGGVGAGRLGSTRVGRSPSTTVSGSGRHRGGRGVLDPGGLALVRPPGSGQSPRAVSSASLIAASTVPSVRAPTRRRRAPAPDRATDAACGTGCAVPVSTPSAELRGLRVRRTTGCDAPPRRARGTGALRCVASEGHDRGRERGVRATPQRVVHAHADDRRRWGP